MFGLPTWFDVTTSAPTTSIPFYLELFGWTVKPLSDTEYGKYLLFHKDGLPVAGLVERGPGTTQPDGWLTYLSTSDIQATLTTAAANKGETQRPALEVVGIGELAVLTDPVRSSIGVAQLGADTQTAPAGLGHPGVDRDRDRGLAGHRRLPDRHLRCAHRKPVHHTGFAVRDRAR